MSLEPVPEVLCPKCGVMKSVKLFRLSRACGKVVFYGCPDCLIRIVEELEAHHNSACSICGVEKQITLFAGKPAKITCPIHAQSRGLLSRALGLLRAGVAHAGELDREEANRLCLDIVTVLGVKDEA